MEIKQFTSEILTLKNSVFRYAQHLLKNTEEAEDTTQDVFLTLWSMRNKIDQYNSPEALAIKITRNRCLDKLKAKRNNQVSLERSHHYLETSLAPPDQKVQSDSSMNRMQQVLKTLPEMQQRLIELRDIQELEYIEIAEMIEKDVNFIRVNLSRARKKIREILQNRQNYGL